MDRPNQAHRKPTGLRPPNAATRSSHLLTRSNNASKRVSKCCRRSKSSTCLLVNVLSSRTLCSSRVSGAPIEGCRLWSLKEISLGKPFQLPRALWPARAVSPIEQKMGLCQYWRTRTLSAAESGMIEEPLGSAIAITLATRPANHVSTEIRYSLPETTGTGEDLTISTREVINEWPRSVCGRR